MGVTNKDQCREAFEAWVMRNPRPGTHLDRSHNGYYKDNRVNAKWAAWQAARSAPTAPVELPEPFALYDGEKWYANEETAICSCANMQKLQKVYTEQQVRELLSQAGTVVAETPESPPKSTETRMDASFQKSRGAYQTGVRGLSDGKAGPKRRESGAYQTVVGFTLCLDVDTLKRPRRL